MAPRKDDGPGKATKPRRHQIERTPYARPKRENRAAAAASTPINGAGLGVPDIEGRQSLLGSVLSAATTPLRAAANLVNKVPILGGYFATTPHDAEQLSNPDASARSDAVSEDDGTASPKGDSTAAAAQQEEGVGAPGRGSPADVRLPNKPNPKAQVAHFSQANGTVMGPVGTGAVERHRAENASPVLAPPRPSALPAIAATQRREGETTPYDDVLRLLRTGPMTGELPLPFPRPRTRDEREAALAEATAIKRRGQSAPAHAVGSAGLGAMVPPATLKAAAGSPDAEGPPGGMQGSQRRLYASSRLGPHAPAGGAGAFGSGLSVGKRPGGGGFTFSRFRPAPAATTQPTPTMVAAAPTQLHAGRAAGALGASPMVSTLAWTPMRSTTPGSKPSMHRPASGLKRKAEEAASDGTTPAADGSISILDAQRRLRQRSEPASASTDRRSWRAGRTPYQPHATRLGLGIGGTGAGRSSAFRTAAGATGKTTAGSLGFSFGLGETPIRPASLSPVPMVGMPTAAAAATPSESTRGKGTTDAARRVLQALDEIDSALKPSTLTPRQREEEAEVPVAPPSATLGGGLLPFSGAQAAGAEEDKASKKPKKKPRVTFAELAGTPPEVQTKPQVPEKGGVHESVGIAAEKPTEGGKCGIEKAAEKPPKAAPPPPKEEVSGRLRQQPEAAAVPPAPPKPLFGFAPTQPPPAVDQAALPSTAPVFAFGTSGRSKELNARVKAIAKHAGPCTDPPPSFVFGTGKAQAHPSTAAEPDDGSKQSGAAVAAPLFAFAGPTQTPSQPQELAATKANEQAKEAAKSPLPLEDEEEQEQEVEIEAVEEAAHPIAKEPLSAQPADKPAVAPLFSFATAPTVAQPEAERAKEDAKPQGAVSSGGWDLSFLQKNKAAASAATEAAAKEIDTSAPAPSSLPAFKFGMPSPSSSAIAAGTHAAAAAAAAASAPSFTFGQAVAASAAAAAPSASASAPSTIGGGAGAVPSFLSTAPPSAPSFGFGAVSSGPSPAFGVAADVAPGKDAESAAAPPKPAPAAEAQPAVASSGWGTDFLASNKAAATKATEAAAKEAAGNGEEKEKEKSAQAAPTFSFGAPGSFARSSAPAFGGHTPAQPTSEAPSTIAFGAVPAAGGAAPATTTFSFGAAPPKAPTDDATAASSSAAGFASTESKPPSAVVQGTSGFGGAPSQPPPFGASTGAATFTFGAGSGSAAAAAPTSAGTFGFGAGAPSAPAAKTFTFGSGASSSAFGNGTGTALASAPAPASTFTFGSSTPSTSFTGSAPGGFPATVSAPSRAAFGAPASAAAPAPAFGFQASMPAAAPAGGTFTFGVSSMPAATEQQKPTGVPFGIASTSAGGGPTSAAPSGFPASSASAPGFGSGFGAPFAGTSSAASMGGGFGSTMTAPSFGSGFGAPGSSAMTATGNTVFGGGGGMGQSTAAFGGGSFQPPPAFGFGQQQQQGSSAFGGGAGFGAPALQQQPQQQQPTFGGAGAGFGMQQHHAGLAQPFGAPQQPPGQMVPTNPFGGAPGGGGFSIGSSGGAGGSQSEGRRKLRVKRANRK